jgi:hypothetical protein
MTRRPIDRKGGRTAPPANHDVALPVEHERISRVIGGERAAATQRSVLRVRKGDPIDDPFATFWEWDTKEDEQAFANLGNRDVTD